MTLSLRNLTTTFLLTTLVGSLTTLTVACARPFTNASGGNHSYENQYNFQYGCEDRGPGQDDNVYFHTFFGDAKFTYSVYLAESQPEFYGIRDNLFNCQNDNPTLTTWKNEYTNLQLIILNKLSLDKFNDLSVRVIGNDDPNIEAQANFLTFIKAHNNAAGRDKDIYQGTQYMPDAIGPSKLSTLSFDVQPIWISIYTKNNARSGLHNLKLELKFNVNGQNITLTRPFQLNVKNYQLVMDDSQQEPSERFGFSATSYPSNAMNYVEKATNNNLITNNASPTAEQIGPRPTNIPYYLTDTYQPYLIEHLKTLKRTNNFYLYGTGFSHQLIQWTGKLSKSGWSDQQYEDYIKNNNFSDVIKDKDWTWTFDFTGLDAYLKLAAKLGYRQFLFTTMDTGNFSFWYLKGASATQGPQRDFKVSLVNAGNGMPGSDFNNYLEFLHSKLIKALSEYWHQVYQKPEYKTPDGKTITLYDSFDELADKTNELTMKNINDNDQYHLIKSNVFAGWRFKYDPFNEKEIQEIFLNKYNQMILQQREIVQKFNNLNIYKLRSNILRRKLLGNSTMIYSSWNNFPASYLQSDNSEQVWGPLLAYKVGANGYVRWAYDFYRDDYYKLGEVSSEFEAGDNFLVYPGDIKGPRLSVRFLNYLAGVQEVHKMMQLIELYPNKRYDINRALNGIGFAGTTTRDNKYKWYPQDFTIDDVKFLQPGLNYQKTVGEQVYELFMYIDTF
ncbi:DUF4091 domain-containing protein [Spiroplasma sp. DGKH1]|uniref:DUF4091 domain-containing protein n=1 Tax=Spiroplasma sp. DGKH1 TaxID=3050074 RepID=UPI0034C5DCC7